MELLIVYVTVNQELCYSSVIYGPTAFAWPPVSNCSRGSLKLFYFMFQTSRKTFMYALSNSETSHISVTSWSLVRRPIKVVVHHSFHAIETAVAASSFIRLTPKFAWHFIIRASDVILPVFNTKEIHLSSEMLHFEVQPLWIRLTTSWNVIKCHHVMWTSKGLSAVFLLLVMAIFGDIFRGKGWLFL